MVYETTTSSGVSMSTVCVRCSVIGCGMVGLRYSLASRQGKRHWTLNARQHGDAELLANVTNEFRVGTVIELRSMVVGDVAEHLEVE
jgi:hypothetical protein